LKGINCQDFFEIGFLNLTWGSVVMLIIGGVLLYLGISKKMEPLLLVPIGFGIILVNLPHQPACSPFYWGDGSSRLYLYGAGAHVSPGGTAGGAAG
jgi:Na+-transporting methylmalonyl-CoA/oxaloacetate decarboxylase beta subunit